MATPRQQLQAMRCLHEGWDGYGAAAPQGKVIDLALEFTDLIEAMLAKSTPSPAVLHVSPTRMGGILIEWEDDSTEHEIDITPSGSIGFLHHDKRTGQIATREFSSLHPGLFQELRQLLAA